MLAPNAAIDKTKKAPIVGTPLTTNVRVTISVQKTDDGAFHGGALDLEIYVPDDLTVEDPGPRHTVRADAAGVIWTKSAVGKGRFRAHEMD